MIEKVFSIFVDIRSTSAVLLCGWDVVVGIGEVWYFSINITQIVYTRKGFLSLQVPQEKELTFAEC